ncbi:MAG: hypothetical protein GY850_12920 [bacterium]|nr:hypothetical protein [bacterium]
MSATAYSAVIAARPFGRTMKMGWKIWPVELVRRRRIIRASFSQERMTYIAADDSSDGVSKVIYQSKDGRSTKTFEALDWLAQPVTHIPNKGEQLVESLPSRASGSDDKVERMVRYYGFYSNKSRGLRKKAGTDDQVPALIEIDTSICCDVADAGTQFAISP